LFATVAFAGRDYVFSAARNCSNLSSNFFWQPMTVYIVKRILLFIPTLLMITLVTFGISRLAPGDPAELKAGIGGEGQRADRAVTAAMVQKIREQWDLDKPLPVQYVKWVGKLFTLDFGKSFKDDKPVIDKILERVPITLLMSLISVVLAYVIAIPIGIHSATHPGSFLDRLSTTTMFMLFSLPSFWIGTLGIVFLSIGSGYIEWFPTSNLHSIDYSETWSFWDKAVDLLWHLALPMIIYTYGSFAFISRQMRGAMLEVIRQDYIRTARAKGLSEGAVVYRHALRNSLIPIITLLAGILPALISGAVIIETIFSIPGMGQLAVQALNERDYPIVMAELTFGAVLTMLGVLIADILYSVVDPRISFE
jgi:peptide/nickel transport system permease protein